MKKRILAMLLAIIMVVGMVPTPAFATETEPAEAAQEIIETTAPATETAETEAETSLPETTEETESEPVVEEPEAAFDDAAGAAPSGDVIGTVRVIVENTTFTAAEGASWDGTLVDTEVTLLDDMTMMTAVLTALNENGHTWEGTSGDDPNGWEITYISSINKNGTDALAEMHGGSDSGWMGTLNDWFVNLGFDQWIAGSNLLDGDVIRVMYTQDRGADLGGAWDTHAGYLSSLTASAGTLAPAFDKETLNYTLTLESGVASLDITASAENKQDKVTITVGDTEYRRGEGVAVADGTEITVACDDKNYVITVSVAAACEHQWTDATCKAPKTCSACGETEGEVGDHSWQDATCKAPKTCSACGSSEGEVGEHSWQDATCKAPKTCSVCGSTEGEVGEHTFVDGVCSVCGETEAALAEKNVTIIAPADSTISSGKFYSYFKYDFNKALATKTLEDGRIQMIVPVPGSQNFLRVQHPKGVTYWDFDGMTAGSVFEITEEMLHIGDTEFTPKTVYADFELNVKDKADLYLTANEKGWLNLSSGETWNLNVFRNFLSLGNSVTNNCVALPDTHYTVISPSGGSSDVVTVTPDANNSCVADITAEKAGTAIILVTYDAVTNNDGEGGKQWSASWPENTGVIIVTVDAGDVSIETNMTVNEEANSTGKQVIDAEHDILFYVGNSGASYSFTPEDGCTVTVNRSTVGSEMSFGGFTASGVYTAGDGTVTVTGLTTGAHIIRVEKNGQAVYQVVRARQVSYEVLDSEGALVSGSNPAEPGETLTVQFHDLISPMEKLSGVYNANFGFYYNGSDGTEIRKAGGTYGVYTFSGNEDLQKFTVTIPTYWNESTYTLTDGAIKIGGFGSNAGAHRTTTYIAGKEVNTNASGVAGVLSVLPDILINTTPCGYNSYNATLPTGEGYTVTGGALPIAEGESYSFTVTVASGYNSENMVVLVNGEAVAGTDGVYTIENVREDLVVTVEGLTKITVDMSVSTAVYTNGVDGSEWGRGKYAYVDTITIGGADVVSYIWDGDTCNVTLAASTAKNAAVGFVITFNGSPASWAAKMAANLNGTAMTAGEPVAINLVDGTATVEVFAAYNNSSKYCGTKTFVLSTEVLSEEAMEQINAVIDLIDSIELPVGLEDNSSIKAAREAYDALEEYQKQLVTNYDVLAEAETELERIKAENTAIPVSITVSIANAGQLVVAQKLIVVTDVNDNGLFDVDDALTIAHADTYPGGYASAYTQYGLGITKLWGDTSGSFGYWLNDAACWSLEDTVAEGDSLMAFVYQDKTAWSDAYAMFDAASYEIEEDMPLTISVEKAGYDEDYNTVFAPYTPILTVLDSGLNEIDPSLYAQNGSEIAISEPGEYYLIASGANGDTLVPAVAKVTVIDCPEAELISGKSVTLKAYDADGNLLKASKVKWTLAEEYAPYASINKSGKLTAKKVVEKVTVYVEGTYEADDQTAVTRYRVDIYPAVSQVKILDESETLVSGKSIPVNVNDGSDETYIFSAGTYPADAMGDVTWTVSDKKGAYITYEIQGNDIIVKPAENAKKGTVTLTATSADGTKKKATVKLNIAVLVEDIDVSAKTAQNVTQDAEGNLLFTVASGKSVTLKAAPTNANATNTAIAWSVVEGSEYAKITASGKLTAVKDLMGVRYAVVRAQAKDGSGVYTDIRVKITPLALGVQMYNSSTGRVCSNTVLSVNMTKQNTLKLHSYVYPLVKANQSVTWKSSNAKIASVTVDEEGYAVVTCRKAGKVTITAIADDGSKEKISMTLKIVEGIESLTLANQVIAVKKKLNLAKLVKINPTTATNKKLTWTILGETYGAKLSSSGVLNTRKVDVSKGAVVLTIRADVQDGCGAERAVCTVTVYPATTKVAILNGEEIATGKTLELEAGKTLTLKGFCKDAANVYTWKSSSKYVAVNDGVITASEDAVGKKVTITCTAADGTNKKATVKIKITAAEAVK